MKQAFRIIVIILILTTGTETTYAQNPLTLMKNRLTGQFEPSSEANFVTVCDREDSTNIMFVDSETYNAFRKMQDAASRDSIDLFIVSGTRNFKRQAAIWERKWRTFPGDSVEKALDILKYSSMPGTSRHHWGTDIDLCSVEDSDWTKPEMLVALRWLNENAVKYGFFMPYSDDSCRMGYKYEPWHWSYYPLSDYYTELYRFIVTYDDINGFAGSSLAAKLKVIERYVFGIAERKRALSMVCVPDHNDADLIKGIERQRDKHEGNGISSRRNHRRQHQ